MANLFNLSHKLYQSLAENCKIYFLGKVFAPVVKHWIMNYFPAVLKMCDVSVKFYSFFYRCEPGFDGGLEQRFMLEVIDVNSAVTLANVSSNQPVFIITGLNPGRDLTLMVFAINKNGRSKPTILEGFTTKVAQLQVGEFITVDITI